MRHQQHALRPFLGLALAALATPTLGLDAPVTLSYHPISSVSDFEREVFAEFERTHPHVTVEIVSRPEGIRYWPYMEALAQSGSLPDVFRVTGGFSQRWAALGRTADLFDVDPEFDTSDYFVTTLQSNLIDGRLIGIPQQWGTVVMFYNKGLFDAAGLEHPNPDWGWAEFREAARTLTRDTDGDGESDQWGYLFNGTYDQVDSWLYRNGGQFLTDDLTRFEINEEGLNTLAFLRDLVLVDGSAPLPSSLARDNLFERFAQGDIAMWVAGSWNMNGLANTELGFEWDIAQTPYGPDATAETERVYSWGNSLSISSKSAHSELAYELIKAMSDRTDPADFPLGQMPPLREVGLSREWYEHNDTVPNRGLLLEVAEQPVYNEFAHRWGDWRDTIEDSGVAAQLNAVFSGDTDLDSAVAEMTAFANEIIAGE